MFSTSFQAREKENEFAVADLANLALVNKDAQVGVDDLLLGLGCDVDKQIEILLQLLGFVLVEVLPHLDCVIFVKK